MTTVVPVGTIEERTLLLFAKSTLDLLTFWPALRLCISQGWSSNGILGKTNLAEDIVDLFYTSSLVSLETLPEEEDIQSIILHNLSHHFNLTLEDDSEQLLSRDLIKLWLECYNTINNIPTTSNLIHSFNQAAQKAKLQDGLQPYQAQRQGISDDEQDDDDDNDDDEDEDEDDQMEGVESTHNNNNNEPVIDEDGFQLVQKGRR
jgi:pre-rRNA-processing protein TSR2